MVALRRSGTVAEDAWSAPATTEPKKRSLADKFELAWISWGIFYSVLRFAVAWGGFSDHGANPWIFGVIDVGTAFPYAKATATLARRVADPKKSRIATPLVVAVTTFFAPYAYLWFAAGTMPAGLRVGLATFVTTLLIAAVVGIVVKSRKLRVEQAAAPDVAGSTAVATPGHSGSDIIDLTEPAPQLVIDLTASEPLVTREITTP